MNVKQIISLICALIVSTLILWHDLPIKFPWTLNIMMLFLKLSGVLVLTVFVYIFTGKKKKA